MNATMKLVSGLVLLVLVSHARSDLPEPEEGETAKDLSDVTITDSNTNAAENAKFINHLIDLLVKRSILEESSGARILATFKIKGDNLKTDGVKPFCQESFKTCQADGDADAHNKFITRLTGLLTKTDKRELHLIEYLLELIMDNALLEINDAGQLAAENGYSIDIKITRMISTIEEIELPDDEPKKPKTPKKPHRPNRPRKHKRRDSTVTFPDPPGHDDLTKFINFLVEFLVRVQIFDKPVGGDILATFDVKPTGDLKGKKLTPTTFKTCKIKAHPVSRKKFFPFVKKQLDQKQPLHHLVIHLLQLLIDNGAIHPDHVPKLAAKHNIIVTITHTKFTPKKPHKPRPAGAKPQHPGPDGKPHPEGPHGAHKHPKRPRGPDSSSSSSESQESSESSESSSSSAEASPEVASPEDDGPDGKGPHKPRPHHGDSNEDSNDSSEDDSSSSEGSSSSEESSSESSEESAEHPDGPHKGHPDGPPKGHPDGAPHPAPKPPKPHHGGHKHKCKSCLRNLTPVFRFYSGSKNVHFYTTDIDEADDAVGHHGYTKERSPGFAATSAFDCHCNKNGFKPVYRLFKPGAQTDQFLTTDANEAENAVEKLGYHSEGISFYCATRPGHCGATKALFRYLRPNEHCYTEDYNEGKKHILDLGQKFEGVLCYLWSSAWDNNCDGPQPPAPAPGVCQSCHDNIVPLHRLYSPSSDDHFYTTNVEEAHNAIAKLGYVMEGSPGLVASCASDCKCGNSLKPVYRLFKSGAKNDHFYTLDANEADNAAKNLGYTREGIAFYCTQTASQCGASAALNRYWRGTDHFYTTDANEGQKNVVAVGGKFEGVTCHIWPSTWKANVCGATQHKPQKPVKPPKPGQPPKPKPPPKVVKPKPAVPKPKPPPKPCNKCINLLPLYRLWNPKTDDHFYTTCPQEAENAATKLGYNRETSPGLVAKNGADCHCNRAGFRPAYRYFRPGAKNDHFYTMNAAEGNRAVAKLGYKREGTAFYCSTTPRQCGASLSLFRFLRHTDHFYTTNKAEEKNVLPHGGKYEGITCYIWPAGYKNNTCVTPPKKPAKPKPVHKPVTKPKPAHPKPAVKPAHPKPAVKPAHPKPAVKPAHPKPVVKPAKPAQPKPAHPKPATPVCSPSLTPLYRLFHGGINDHFYTTNAGEANNAAGRLGYGREGTPGRVASRPAHGLVPMYRLWKGAPADHFYTTNAAEANNAATRLGYGREGIAFYCSPKPNHCGAKIPWHRYWRGTEHFYTPNTHEGQVNVIARGGTHEGIACYIWP
jgi:outer membrane biosynthesis protein TonB